MVGGFLRFAYAFEIPASELSCLRAGDFMVTDGSKPSGKGIPPAPCAPEEPLDLIGPDGRDLRYIFVSPPKFVVGTTVPDPVYFRLLDHPGGISGFYENALKRFDGNLDVLLLAAARFSDDRKKSRESTAIRSANGRVSQEAHEKIRSIVASLRTVRGMSKAKVLGGLIQLYLQ